MNRLRTKLLVRRKKLGAGEKLFNGLVPCRACNRLFKSGQLTIEEGYVIDLKCMRCVREGRESADMILARTFDPSFAYRRGPRNAKRR